jgi:hypothetical protein
MSARRTQLDQAIDKLSAEIQALELARQRLIALRTERDRQKAKRPQAVPAKAGA